MNELSLDQDILRYECGKETWNKEFSWNLPLSNIRVIGVLNCIVGDNDFTFLVFIDQNKKVYPLNFTYYDFKGESVLRSFLISKGIEYDTLISISYDFDLVLFPNELRETNVFKKSIVHKIKTLLDIEHVANGILDDNVVLYIEKENNG